MIFSRVAISSALSLALFISNTNAVLYGDEHYGDVEGGRFWAFYNHGYAVIDPETCQIERQVKDEANLPSSWADGIYMEYHDHDDHDHDHRGRKLAHPGHGKGYILINSGDNTEDENTGQLSSEILVFDTDKDMDAADALVSRIKTGSRMVHSYGVYTRNEFWSHSDADGHFYVVDISDVSKHTGATVKKFESVPSHSKLLWSESAKLGDRAFSTTTSEHFLWEVNMETKSVTQQFDFSNFVTNCNGLHSIAYSAAVEHIFAECVGGGGTLEFDVSNNGIKFLKQWTGRSGSIYEVPDGSYVLVSNKGGDKVHIFQSTATGQEHTVVADIDLPGNPSTVTFYPLNQGGEADYVACMPQVENPITKQSYFCDGSGCSGATTQEQVDHGVCLHDTENTLELMMVADPSEVVPGEAPFYEACNRCTDQANFVNGTCTCTPNCGSCIADDDKDYDDANIGSYCMDLQEVVSTSATQRSDAVSSGLVTHIQNAGAVKPGYGYAYSPACQYGRTYRQHKRGGKYDASVANVPYDSIVIIDMSTQTKKCEVKLDGAPSRVIYAPLEPESEDESDDEESSSAPVVKSAFALTIGFVASIFLL